MKETYLLSVDLGTSFIKAAAYDLSGVQHAGHADAQDQGADNAP